MADAIISLNQRLLGTDVANVVCFSNVTENATDLQDFADNIRAAYAADIVGGLTDSWSLEDIKVSFLTATAVDYSVDVSFTLGPLVGTQVSEPLPTTVALLGRTSYIGSAPNRGRFYQAGITEISLVEGLFTVGMQTSVADLLATFRDGIGIGAGTAFLRILRRPSAKFPAFVSSPVSITSADPIPATIRGRRLSA